MSGIVGIINLDGAPVHSALLLNLLETIEYRGPDKHNIWIDRNVGFGHTLLCTTYEAQNEQQPYSTDGEVWIIADARIDGRAELIEQLRGKGFGISASITDAELVLYAYQAWDEQCVKHIIGDFAFAIWDGRQRKFFCARDHLGVKPFYYAQVGNTFIFSNTLNCVREHPLVSDKLNDAAIGDFLLFGYNQEISTTSFLDIKRLEPAHSLTISKGYIAIEKYWQFPLDSCLRYKNASDYVDHFRELLFKAVDDRVRADKVSVFMSGGLDSTSVTSIATQLRGRSKNTEVQVYTSAYEYLSYDPEPEYAKAAAEYLNIPIHVHKIDDYRLFERISDPVLQSPEPYEQPLGAMHFDQVQNAARHSRVILTGQGADPILSPPELHYSLLMRRLQVRKIISSIYNYYKAYNELPQFYIVNRLKLLLSRKRAYNNYDSFKWVNQNFLSEARRIAQERLLHVNEVAHSARPEAIEQLDLAWWTCIFEQFDGGWIRCPVEFRHPFFDIRLLEFMLAIPPTPWCLNKNILRSAMCGLLPEAVRIRPKSYISDDPVSLRLHRGDTEWLRDLELTAESKKYLKDNTMFCEDQFSDAALYPGVTDFRPFYLAIWLQQLKQTRLKEGWSWKS